MTARTSSITVGVLLLRGAGPTCSASVIRASTAPTTTSGQVASSSREPRGRSLLSTSKDGHAIARSQRASTSPKPESMRRSTALRTGVPQSDVSWTTLVSLAISPRGLAPILHPRRRYRSRLRGAARLAGFSHHRPSAVRRGRSCVALGRPSANLSIRAVRKPASVVANSTRSSMRSTIAVSPSIQR